MSGPRVPSSGRAENASCDPSSEKAAASPTTITPSRIDCGSTAGGVGFGDGVTVGCVEGVIVGSTEGVAVGPIDAGTVGVGVANGRLDADTVGAGLESTVVDGFGVKEAIGV